MSNSDEQAADFAEVLNDIAAETAAGSVSAPYRFWGELRKRPWPLCEEDREAFVRYRQATSGEPSYAASCRPFQAFFDLTLVSGGSATGGAAHREVDEFVVERVQKGTGKNKYFARLRRLCDQLAFGKLFVRTRHDGSDDVRRVVPKLKRSDSDEVQDEQLVHKEPRAKDGEFVVVGHGDCFSGCDGGREHCAGPLPHVQTAMNARERRAFVLPGRPGAESVRIEATDQRVTREATDRVLTVCVDRPGLTSFLLSAGQAERLARDLLAGAGVAMKEPK